MRSIKIPLSISVQRRFDVITLRKAICLNDAELRTSSDDSYSVGRDVREKTWQSLLGNATLPKEQYPFLEGIKTILATRRKRQT